MEATNMMNNQYSSWGMTSSQWISQWTSQNNSTISPIEFMAQSITKSRAETKQRSNQQVISDLVNSQNTMYWSAMANRNKATSAEEMKAAQLDAFAAIVKWRAIEDWYEDEWSEYNTTKDIVSHYIDLNNSDAVNKRLIQYANSQEDPYDFAMSMWVLLSPDEKRIRNTQKELDTLFWEWNTPKWFTNFVDLFGNRLRWGLSSFVEPIKKWVINADTYDSESDEAPIVWAIENYAYWNFWKNIYQLDEYEANKALNELKDIETLKKYLPNSATATANIVEWGVWWVLTAAFPIMSLWYSGIWEIPVVWDVVNWTLSTLATTVWAALANSIFAPVWIPMEIWLNNREERQAFYEALWWLFFLKSWKWWMLNKWNWWLERWNFNKSTINQFKNFLNSDVKEVIWDAWDKVKWWWETVLWWIINKVKENKKNNNEKLQEKRLKEAWELKWWLWEVADREKIANAVNEIEDVNKIKSSEDLSNEWNDAKKRIWKEKTDLLDKNEKTYGEKDLDYIEKNKSWEDVSTEPFMKALEKMIEDETNPVKKSDYENYLNKIKDWEITHREIEELIADFDTKYADSTYRENWERKPNLSARERDDLRRWMRKRSWQLADESWVEWLTSDALWELNKRYGDTSRASSIAETLNKKSMALQERLNKLPRYKKAMQLIWKIPLTILDSTWLLQLGRSIIWKSSDTPKYRNALDIEKIINKKIKSIDKINKMLDNWESSENIIKWLKDEWLVSDMVDESETSESPLE